MHEAQPRRAMGGCASGGVTTGHLDNAAHYECRAIDVFLRHSTDRGQAGLVWVLAQWLVAHADRLRVLSVIYRDRIWMPCPRWSLARGPKLSISERAALSTTVQQR